MPKIYDNIHMNFSDGILEHLSSAVRVDYCAGYFNLRGWKTVCDAVSRLPGGIVSEANNTETLRFCRLLVGMTKTPREELLEQFAGPEDLIMDNDKASKYRKQLAAEFAEQLTIGSPTAEDERTLQCLLTQLKAGTVVVKLYLKNQLHAKLYLAHSLHATIPVVGLLGSSNLTFSGFSAQGELNLDVLEQDAAIKLDRWYNDRWNDRWCLDITQDLIEVLENSWARPEDIPPYYIYLKTAYHLSREARAGLAEYKLSGKLADELFDFQQAAVKIAAHHLNARGGVVIGDVVGLGKTMVAAAVAKLLEDDHTTLILCPKNLVPMWEWYSENYGLRAKVLSHSLILRELPNLRRYKLVIVDESHNFRNSLGENYRALKKYIDDNGSKVMLLSATPYNKSYTDLSNQLRLFMPEDYDLGIVPEQYIASLGGMVQFNAKHTDTNIRTIAAFEKSDFPDDWREVMKLYLVRRTRSFIKNNYAKTDAATGRKYLVFANGAQSFFPDRIPKRIEFSFNAQDTTDQYAKLYDDEVVNIINGLNLPRYGLKPYLDSKNKIKLTEEEKKTLANLSRAGKRVIGFCRTNLFKRLESSGYAFLLSLTRHILRDFVYLHAIQNDLDLPVAGQSVSVDIDLYGDTDEENEDGELDFDWEYEVFQAKAAIKYAEFRGQYKNRFQWLRSKLFNRKMIVDDLRSDIRQLLGVLTKASHWLPQNDRKLEALIRLVRDTHAEDKLLVFTQFKDTAEYLQQELVKAGVKKSALVVGGSDNVVGLVNRFSPDSNGYPVRKDEHLRVLITTDVLSEGQNLQDAHIIVNFDLPWAIVRLIQRAGRVDRLGQKSSEILCYSFLPEDGIERIIGLRGKLARRISENAEVVGSDEVFFEGDPINISDLYSEKSNIYDETEDAEVDLASFAYQIWKNAIDANPALEQLVEQLPNLVFSAKANTSLYEGDGAIVYARTGDNDALAWLNTDAKIVTQSQFTILKALACSLHTPCEEKLDNHHHLVAEGVRLIQKDSGAVTGTLGRKNSIKHRVYTQLERFYSEHEGTPLASDALKKAMDEIYQYQLKESTSGLLNQHMRTQTSDEDMVRLVLSLYENKNLCNKADNDDAIDLAQIICSMSMIGGQQ